jgi:hypothetical protein
MSVEERRRREGERERGREKGERRRRGKRQTIEERAGAGRGG